MGLKKESAVLRVGMFLRRPAMFVFGALALCAAAFGIAWALLPFPEEMIQSMPCATVLLDSQQRPIRVRLGAGDVDCRPIALAAAGKWTPLAIMAAEDKRFYKHLGLDMAAVARALFLNICSGRIVSGASTLSTQVVKLSAPARRRTLSVKIIEAILAFKLEQRFSKDEILRMYLNRAPFGSNLMGLEAASLRYFGKHAADLSLAESALLAGLPKSPSRLRPDRRPEKARVRRDYVLARMEACGFITSEQRSIAEAEPVATRSSDLPFYAPHFCELALAKARHSGVLETTLDSDLQSVVERLVQQRMTLLRKTAVHGAAVVVLEVPSGRVRAMLGSPDFFDSSQAGQVNAACAPRSPGSALKPFIYAMAFDAGLASPASVSGDVPLYYRQYRPLNFDLEFSGPVSMREALVRSLNMPALRIAEQLGYARVLESLKSMGFTTLTRPASEYGIAIALGAGETTLLELANAYACLARNGEWLPARLFKDEQMLGPTRIFSEEAAFMVTDILSGDERIMELCGHAAPDAVRPAMAWKTGTSSGLRDAWTVIYNPELVVAVWLGNPDGAAAEVLVGAKAAAPLAYDIFRSCVPAGRAREFKPPHGLATRHVCARSGCLPGPYCPAQVEDYAIPGVSPNQVCRVHLRPPVNGEAPETWPAPIANFLQRGDFRAGVRAAPEKRSVRILSPVSGETFRVLPPSPGLCQELSFTASAFSPGEKLYWFVNDRFLETAPVARAVFWPLERGKWKITCADSAGRQDSINIVVE